MRQEGKKNNIGNEYNKMTTIKGITIKLDGNPPQQEARATGHKCDWICLKNRTLECSYYEKDWTEQMRKDQIERWRNDIMKYDYTDYHQRYDFFEAYNGLVQNNAIAVKTRKHRGYELGAREFTLTYSPKWMNDAQARTEMTQAMNKLVKYYEGSIVKLRAVGEVGSNGLSHIHCFYKLQRGLKITDKNFKRAWEYWNPKKKLGKGFEGGHHATVKEEADFLGYIDKDILTSWFEINISDADIPNGPQTSAQSEEEQSDEETSHLS